MNHIKVTYNCYSTAWSTRAALIKLAEFKVLSFDTETKGIYSKAQREEASKLLEHADLSLQDRKLVSIVANNSGLSFPSLVELTHFVFGTSESHSNIFIPSNFNEEMFIWRWIRDFEGTFIIHNTLFDLKLMYHRIGQFPKHYHDSQLLAKTLVNHCDVWKSKVDLKHLMGSWYDPKWALFDDYEPEDKKNPEFLMYAAIDGASTFKLWVDLQVHVENDSHHS